MNLILIYSHIKYAQNALYKTKLDESSLGISKAFSTCCTSVSEKASQILVSWAKEIAQIAQNAVALAIPNKKAPLEHIAVDVLMTFPFSIFFFFGKR